MKILLSCLSISLVFCTVATAQDSMIPLSEVGMKTSLEKIYLMKRCAGVSLLMSIRIRNPEDLTNLSESEELSKTLLERYNRFAHFAFLVHYDMMKRQGRPVVNSHLDAIIGDIKGITDLYQLEMDRAYQMTGRTISDLVNEDTKVCTYFATQEWFTAK